MVNVLYVVLLTLVAALIAAVAQYLFKRSMPKFNFNAKEVLSLAKNKAVIAGLVIYVISLVIYLTALKYGDLSFVYPTFASVFVFVLLISKFKLHEEISARRAAGMALVLLGILLVVVTY